ncbi:MAG TPA: 3-keto-5-aminohexanoate cleavage protein [Clostridiaceae bacterium]|nr:3-keto-5-aminohexanoate cleavage protein [Clostridiaceae bacterium]
MSKKRREKTIITASITGAIHTPSMSPYLPKGKDEIIQNAVDAWKAGAAIVHIHARKPVTGEPTSDLDYFREILNGIKEQCNVVIGITTGGALGMTVEERFAVLSEFQPEMATCNAGTSNFVLSELTKTFDKPQFDWEEPFLLRTYDSFFKNTFADIEHALTLMNEHRIRPEFEVFDLGQINTVAYFRRKGLVKDPIYIQFVPGTLGGIPLSNDNITFMIKTAQQLLGSDIRYSLVGSGRRMFRAETFHVLQGGNVRVGMEDSLYINIQGELARNNAEQVTKIKSILELLDYEIASSDEAREMLQLKGVDKVNF